MLGNQIIVALCRDDHGQLIDCSAADNNPVHPGPWTVWILVRMTELGAEKRIMDRTKLSFPMMAITRSLSLVAITYLTLSWSVALGLVLPHVQLLWLASLALLAPTGDLRVAP